MKVYFLSLIEQVGSNSDRSRRVRLFAFSSCRRSAPATGGTSRRTTLSPARTRAAWRPSQKTQDPVFSSDFRGAFEALKNSIKIIVIHSGHIK